jgi:hypothetical protein
MLPSLFYMASIILIPKPRKTYKTGKPQTNILHEHKCKNTQQNTSKSNSTHVKRIVHHNQLGFIPGIQY